jgi:xylulokinase
MTHYLGIDTSTTATKALLVDGSGTIVGVGRSTYGYDTPRPLWSEQDPAMWWEATKSAIGQVLAASGVDAGTIRGIGLTGQMHGLVLLDDQGDVLRPAILWNDQRTQAECDEIREIVGKEELIRITGNDALTGFTAPKILWVKHNEPGVFDRTATVLLPKDYVRHRLTGKLAMDRAGGSGTILFDLAHRDWSDVIAHALGVPRSWLPQTFEGTEETGSLSAAAAKETGLREGTPVYGGGGDQAANGVGVGAVEPGIAAVSIGTSGVVFAPTDRPTVEPEGRLHAFCHAVPDRWHLMGVMLSAAGSLEWFRRVLAPDRSFDEIDVAAGSVSAGAGGLQFLPYLSGERTPYADPLARGAFVGLTVRHELAHMARAVLEGVAFGLLDSLRLIQKATHIDEARASGGGAASRLWLQIIADVLGVPVRPVATPEGAAHGAALLAATGAGSFASVAEACGAAVHAEAPFEPSEDAAIYAEAYEVYRRLYPDLHSGFVALSNLDR